jgi:hypothetical protein
MHTNPVHTENHNMNSAHNPLPEPMQKFKEGGIIHPNLLFSMFDRWANNRV